MPNEFATGGSVTVGTKRLDNFTISVTITGEYFPEALFVNGIDRKADLIDGSPTFEKYAGETLAIVPVFRVQPRQT